MRQVRNYIISIVLTILMLGCTGSSDESRAKDRPTQASDTVYTEQAIMEAYASNPERALLIIDSAEMVGTDVRAELMRAMVYSRTTEGFQFDTAIRIAERLVKNEKVLADPEMLHEQPDATISEVAEQVGLTLRNLQRLFREQYGMSPSEYRYSHK